MINAAIDNEKSAEALEVAARAQGVLDADGYFTQEDWEFELDTLQDTSREALLVHLERSPGGNQTAVFLKGYLMNNRSVHFTPFDI